jgi:hypothetical protein
LIRQLPAARLKARRLQTGLQHERRGIGWRLMDLRAIARWLPPPPATLYFVAGRRHRPGLGSLKSLAASHGPADPACQCADAEPAGPARPTAAARRRRPGGRDELGILAGSLSELLARSREHLPEQIRAVRSANSGMVTTNMSPLQSLGSAWRRSRHQPPLPAAHAGRA